MQVRYSDGQPAGNADVTLKTEFVPRSGGHDHQTEPRMGFGGFRSVAGGSTQASITGKADAMGQLRAEFVAGRVGGFERLVATASDGVQEAKAQTVVDIRVVSQEPLAPGADYLLIGTETEEGKRHLSNHWGLRSVLGGLQSIALTVRQLVNDGDFAGPLVLQYNDMTLEQGGVFDLAGNFAPEHFSHNRGIDVDVAIVFGTSGGSRVRPTDPGARRLDLDELKEAVEVQALASIVLDESNRNHYHIRFLSCP